MKWGELKRLVFFIISTIFIVPSMMATIQHRVIFSSENIVITQDTVNAIAFSKVKYAGLVNTGDVGSPSLPVKYLTFSVPYDAYNISVVANTINETNIELPSIVFPEQEKRTLNDVEEFSFAEPDSLIYNSSEMLYPMNIATVVDEGFYFGNHHIVTIEVFPIQYDITNSLLQVNNTIDLTITYSCGEGLDSLKIKPILRFDTSDNDQTIENVKGYVVNPEQVVSNSAPIPVQQMTRNTSSSVYEYCVITSRELAPAFERLVAYKRWKGYDAGIVCMEDILNNPNYQDGDVTSGINDDAGKLRAYLSYAFEAHALKYVLLGGKPPHVPIRYGYDNSRFGQIPTDLYFSEFNGDWNVDGDAIYGETNVDAVDYYQDVYIGRLLCNTIEEANNYVEKLMLYELNPGNGNVDYLGRSLAVYSAVLNPRVTVNLASYFEGCDTIVQNGTFPNGAYVINQINNTHYGMLFFNGHGNPGAITISETEDGRSVGVNAEDSVSCYLNTEDGNAFDCLTNIYTPSICYAHSCANIPFDIYNEYDIKYNLGESFTLKNKQGGVAYIGYTRDVYTDYAISIEKLFASNLKSKYNIGQAVMDSKIYTPSSKAHLLSYNLLGDPEMAVWTQKPDVYSDVEISVNRMDNSIYVTGCSIGDCIVSAYTPERNVYKYEMENNGGVNMTISPNSAIMIYRQNMIPYFPPLLIQNQAYEKSQYLFASSVQIGKFVDSERSIQGDVVFWNNIDFVIEATDDVYIGDGVIVYPGSTLTIKSKKAVTIDGALIKAGSKFIVEASEIRVRDSFEAENEAIIEFNPLKQ